MASVNSIAAMAFPVSMIRINPSGSWGTSTSFARPANITAYSAGAVISDSTSTAASLFFPNTGINGQVIAAHVISEDNGFAAANLELFVFDSAPADHLDGAALAVTSANLPFLVQRFSFPNTSSVLLGTNIRLWEMDGANKFQQGRGYCTGTSEGLYGLLVTRSAATPAANSLKFHVRLSLQAY